MEMAEKMEEEVQSRTRLLRNSNVRSLEAFLAPRCEASQTAASAAANARQASLFLRVVTGEDEEVVHDGRMTGIGASAIDHSSTGPHTHYCLVAITEPC